LRTNLGAGYPARAVRTGWLAVGLSSAGGIVFSIVIWLWVEPILRISTSDPALVEIAATFLRIQIIGYLVWGLVVTLSLVLNGVGDTMVMMVTNLVTMWGVQICTGFIPVSLYQPGC
jgi:MATE family multidrug resistance protein